MWLTKAQTTGQWFWGCWEEMRDRMFRALPGTLSPVPPSPRSLVSKAGAVRELGRRPGAEGSMAGSFVSPTVGSGL